MFDYYSVPLVGPGLWVIGFAIHFGLFPTEIVYMATYIMGMLGGLAVSGGPCALHRGRLTRSQSCLSCFVSVIIQSVHTRHTHNAHVHVHTRTRAHKYACVCAWSDHCKPSHEGPWLSWWLLFTAPTQCGGCAP